MNRTGLILGIVSFAALVASVLLFTFLSPGRFAFKSFNTTVNDSLRIENVAFKVAEDAFVQGNYQDAVVNYKQALLQAGNLAQEGQVRYRLGVTQIVAGDEVAGITTLKDVVVREEYLPITRSYAVQYLGQAYYSSANPEEVYQQVFTTKPFSSLVAPKRRDITLRFLFEYATSLYPLAISELRVAQWYAQGLVYESVDQVEYARIIDERLKRAEADIARMRDVSDEHSVIPTALMHRARLFALLFDVERVQAQIVEEAYEDTLTAFKQYGVPGGDSFARLSYARFLAETGETVEVSVKVRGVVMPLYTDPAYQGSGADAFLKSYSSDTQGIRASIIKVARLDPGFRDYLVRLGWGDAGL